MPKITIVRPYEWNNQKRRIKIFIDDKHVGHVGIDETAHFEVSPGKHTLRLKYQWPGKDPSLEIDLSDNEDKTVRMSTSTQSFWATFFIAFFSTMIYSLVRSYFDIELNWYINIIVAAAVVFVALLIFSKKEILKLVEE